MLVIRKECLGRSANLGTFWVFDYILVLKWRLKPLGYYALHGYRGGFSGANFELNTTYSNVFCIWLLDFRHNEISTWTGIGPVLFVYIWRLLLLPPHSMTPFNQATNCYKLLLLQLWRGYKMQPQSFLFSRIAELSVTKVFNFNFRCHSELQNVILRYYQPPWASLQF